MSDILLYMAKSLEKQKSLALRKGGYSITEIANTLHISKSTVSIWCRDVILSKDVKEKLHKRMVLAGNAGRMLGAKMNKEKKEKVIADVKNEVFCQMDNISKRDLLMLGIGLYWGEGAKNSKPTFTFVNSDPDSIVLIINWLQTVFAITKSELQLQIYINAKHAHRTDRVHSFWSSYIKIPKKQFRKTVLVYTNTKKVYENEERYTGILHLSVAKSSRIKYKTLAMIDYTKEYMQNKKSVLL